MKTKEELRTIKAEYEALKVRLSELTDEELMQVVGGRVMEHDEMVLAKDSAYSEHRARLEAWDLIF